MLIFMQKHIFPERNVSIIYLKARLNFIEIKETSKRYNFENNDF